MVMDETIINGVEFVDVVYHLAASIAHKFLDECVSAKGNTQANVAFIGEGGWCDRVLEGGEVCITLQETFGSCEGGVCRDVFFARIWVLSMFSSRPATSLKTCVRSARMRSATLRGALM